MEALLAFFLESTFIGLWIFGWDRLSPRLHLASIWLVAIGTILSAYFILAANSWMQHPVGYRVNPATHRVVLTSIIALLTNSTVLAALPHMFFAAFMVAGAVLVAASAWHLARKSQHRRVPPGDAAGPGGHAGRRDRDRRHRRHPGPDHGVQQPMKMAAAEALYNTSDAASFSLFTIGSLNGSKELWSIRVPACSR